MKCDLTGLRFGKLIVLRKGSGFREKDGHARTTWVCHCDCGQDKEVRADILRRGDAKSCGCSQQNALKFLGDEASFRELYREYRDGAKRRGLVFEINADEFHKITSQDCIYCGAKPNKLSRARKGTRIHYVYNGIDRFDNQYGYTKENSVPCCSICNHMKCAMTVPDFLTHAKRIADFTTVYNSARLVPEFN